MTDPCLNQDTVVTPEATLVQDDIATSESTLAMDNVETIPCSEN